MKESKYNYYITENGRGIIFNGRTKKFFTCSKKTQPMYEMILKSPNSYYKEYSKFIDRMKQSGFVLEDNQDEYQLVMEDYIKESHPDEYRLMVLPTFRCNVSCWYCYQDHRHEDMSYETMKRIKLHIEKYLIENDIKSFYLTWFGGEPLIKYDLLLDLTRFSKCLCNKLGIPMSSSITTNSLLLNQERIKQLKDVNVKMFQITLDGTREEHNKVKYLPNKDTFTMALNNIVDILTIIPDSTVTLRINYSKKQNNSQQIIDEIKEIIPNSFLDRINLNIQKVWQEENSILNEKGFNNLISYSKEKGFSPSVIRGGRCYVDNAHFNTIFPNGSVDVCDHEGLDVIGRGELTVGGDIKWNHSLMCFKYNIKNENIICNKCKHMPMCGGPCPAKRNQLYAMPDVEKFAPCPYEDMDMAIKRDIRNLYITYKGIE